MMVTKNPENVHRKHFWGNFVDLHISWRRFTKKKYIDIMRFTDIDVNFDVKYEGHQNCPKMLSVNILRVFSDHHM